MIEIWLNPACSKCRTAGQRARGGRGVEYVVRRYLEQPPTTVRAWRTSLATVSASSPGTIARTADASKLGVTLPAKDLEHRHAWLELMSDHPGLIQRPIITASDGTTVVGPRPGVAGAGDRRPAEAGSVSDRPLAFRITSTMPPMISVRPKSLGV